MEEDQLPNRLDRNAENISDALIEHLDGWEGKGYNIDIDRLKRTLRDAQDQGDTRSMSWTYSSGTYLSGPLEWLRELLLSLRDCASYKEALGAIEVPELRQKVETFVNEGKITDEWPDLDQYPPSATLHGSEYEKPIISEDEKKTWMWLKRDFHNWGKTVERKEVRHFYPTTVSDVQEIVRWARAMGRRVRCAGFRHSWSPIHADDNEVLISFVSPFAGEYLTNCMSLSCKNFDNDSVHELRKIHLLDTYSAIDGTKRLCKVGVAVTNEDFRRWAIKNNQWALPLDVILVEVTVGGVNGPICHGAGYRHKTVSDLVECVEYVDCKGKLHTVSDAKQLRAAAGSFGLMGVVTHLTLRLDKMTYVQMNPSKEDAVTAVPPPDPSLVPPGIQPEWFKGLTPEAARKKLAKHISEFENHALNDYYSEWFWFPYQKEVWVNTWNTVEDGAGATDYPHYMGVFCHWVQGWVAGWVTECPCFHAFPNATKASALGWLSMKCLPDGQQKKTYLTNALHFRRGVHNMRVRDVEFEIPLPPSKDDPTKPDLDVARKAWWDVINLFYSDNEPSMRVALEMRIMADSDIIMAPQYGNGRLGTASIEVLTVGNPKKDKNKDWDIFTQKVADKWMKYQYRAEDGSIRMPKPHWAKEWRDLKVDGVPMEKFLKETAYPTQIREFKKTLESIGKDHGWKLDDLKNTFSNKFWDEMIWS